MLETLDMSNIGHVRFPTAALAGLDRLKSLKLVYYQFHSLPADAFDRQKDLIELDISFNEFYSLPEGLLTKLSKLEYLKMRECGFNEYPVG